MAEKFNECWSVNNDHGFVARHSDFLVSGTTIVGSLFCSRRSVLADIYKGLDCSSVLMVIGILLHQLLQTVFTFLYNSIFFYPALKVVTTQTLLFFLQVLKRKLFYHDDIKAVVDEMLNSSGFVHTLYESDMSLETTKKELMDFIPKIQSFIETYMLDSKT